MYAVMGATGQTGGAVLRALRARGAEVRAVTRDAAAARALIGPGVEIAEAREPGGLAAAFAGTRGAYVLCVPPADAVDPLAAARETASGIAAALAEARPPRVVALSSEGVHREAGTGIILALRSFEAALAAAGVAAVRLRATFFTENWASGLAAARAEGVLPSLLQPLDRPVAMVSSEDVGLVAAELLVAGSVPEVVNLTGPAPSTPNEVAAAFAAALGRPVQAVAPPRAGWEAALEAAGLGAGYAAALAAMHDAINAGRVGFEPGVGVGRRGHVSIEAAVSRIVAAGAERRPA